MSKRSASSVPLLVGGALFRKRVDSPASQSGSSFDPSVELNGDLLAPLPLTYAYIAPPLVGPASTVVEDDLVEWQTGTHPAPSEGESTVLWARQLPLDRRQVDFLISETVLRRNSLWRNMSGSGADDSFAAYQEAAKVMSAKKGSASRATSRDDVTVIGSQRAIMVKTEPTSSSQRRKTRGGGVVTRASHRSADADCSAGTLATALANLNMSVFPRDGTVLLIGETSEVIQVLQDHFPALSSSRAIVHQKFFICPGGARSSEA
ncbi:hypothetical protein Bca52824_023523 [Brassica carinata]|uniref:Uncharacterized protein n=1 Tax=Brassica carinata TaxID=52824 RepID=A0A8X7VIL8_BRACI|nr:hypothetical protein Bca52824_023523 [Brassica carinata]